MTIREFIDAMQQLTSDGWLHWDEALLLVSYAEMTSGPIVEFGCYMGRSAMLLSQVKYTSVEEINGGQLHRKQCRKLICVDSWDGSFSSEHSGNETYKKFRVNMESIGAIADICRCRVEDWPAQPAGFVYCDGDHSYDGTMAQARKAIECDPQYVAFHDVSDSVVGANVKRACLKVLGEWREKINGVAVWGPLR